MNNEAIGIGGVFTFTLLLFLLRYLYLSLRREDRNRYAAPTRLPEAHEMNEGTGYRGQVTGYREDVTCHL